MSSLFDQHAAATAADADDVDALGISCMNAIMKEKNPPISAPNSHFAISEFE
jgi:hypothetical protein